MNIEKFLWEKVKLGKFSTESEHFLEIGGNLKQEGNASLPQGNYGCPCLYITLGGQISLKKFVLVFFSSIFVSFKFLPS